MKYNYPTSRCEVCILNEVTKPGGFLRRKYFITPLNSTGYTARIQNNLRNFLRNNIFKKKPHLQWRAIYILATLLFFIFPVESYAANECSNTNPYLQQTCENLKRSANKAQEARDEATKKEIASHEKAQRKMIEEENKPPEAPPPQLPEWQKPLSSNASSQNKTNSSAKEKKPTDTAPTVTPLPPPTPTEFANPKPVTLPGGLNIIPVKPEKDNPKGPIKYY